MLYFAFQALEPSNQAVKLVGLFELTMAWTWHNIFLTYLCCSRIYAWLQQVWCALLAQGGVLSAPPCLQWDLHFGKPKSVFV